MAEAMIRKGSFSYQRTSTSFLKIPMSSTDPAESDANPVKAVGFDLPGKRQKPSAQLTAHTVVNDIHNSITKKDRINAIFTACATFNHGIEAVHDEEIQAGADIALVKHLTVLLLQRDRMRTSLAKQQKVKENQQPPTDTRYCGGNSSDNPALSSEPKNSLSVDLSPYTQADVMGIETEINDTVSAIEMVLRCSADSVSISFSRAGSDLLLLLLDIIQEETRKLQERENFPCSSPVETSITAEKNSTSTLISLTNDDKPPKTHHDSSSTVSTLVPETVDKSQRKEQEVAESRLKTSTKIIGHFARVGSLTEAMAHTPSFLQTLQEIISLPPQHKAPVEATLNSLWILANLACSAENMVLMARTPNLIPVLVDIASHPTKEEEGSMDSITLYMELIRSRSIAVRAILNLSWAHENKVPFASNPALLDALLETVSHRTSPWAGGGRGVSGVLLQSRRHAAGALRNLGAAPRRYKRSLCRLRSGTFLDILAEIASNDPDSSVRDKMHATLYNLVSADTAKLFTEKQYVIDVISEAAMKKDEYTVEDGSDSHTMASRTLRTLERSIPEDEEGYKVLRPHLMKRFDSIANSMTSIVQCTSSEAV